MVRFKEKGILWFRILDNDDDLTAVASISQPIMNMATARITNPTCEAIYRREILYVHSELKAPFEKQQQGLSPEIHDQSPPKTKSFGRPLPFDYCHLKRSQRLALAFYLELT